jgi:hypothetical protein
MRRLIAHLALAAILSSFLSPLAVALHSSGTPACCLPGGKHHCRQTPTGPGFKSQNDNCPYATLAITTEVKAVRVAKFGLAAPAVVGYFGVVAVRGGYRFIASELSARGPPRSFL